MLGPIGSIFQLSMKKVEKKNIPKDSTKKVEFESQSSEINTIDAEEDKVLNFSQRKKKDNKKEENKEEPPKQKVLSISEWVNRGKAKIYKTNQQKEGIKTYKNIIDLDSPRAKDKDSEEVVERASSGAIINKSG